MHQSIRYGKHTIENTSPIVPPVAGFHISTIGLYPFEIYIWIWCLWLRSVVAFEEPSHSNLLWRIWKTCQKPMWNESTVLYVATFWNPKRMIMLIIGDLYRFYQSIQPQPFLIFYIKRIIKETPCQIPGDFSWFPNLHVLVPLIHQARCSLGYLPRVGICKCYVWMLKKLKI